MVFLSAAHVLHMRESNVDTFMYDIITYMGGVINAASIHEAYMRAKLFNGRAGLL